MVSAFRKQPSRGSTRSSTSAAEATSLRFAALALIGFALYANTLGAPFTFDDEHAIVINEQIRHLSTSLAPTEQGSPLAGRPLVSLTFAVNYALGGLNVRVYRLLNASLALVFAPL